MNFVRLDYEYRIWRGLVLNYVARSASGKVRLYILYIKTLGFFCFFVFVFVRID